ncbi:MAG: trypsin-like peptidase domain-containing protein [Ruminococcus sp.]|nr:trypsin-like peptidase domain-containing protein [Ruminococcus sp.]
MDNMGFNSYNNEINNGTAAPESYTADFAPYSAERVHEVTYAAPKKKNRGRAVLAGIVGILSVVAIGATSIVGYDLIKGDSIGVTKTADSETNDKEVKKSSAAPANTDLPTIVQLASPEDAMSIPDIVTKVSPSVVGVSCVTTGGVATGTGIIMSSDGYIITNAHVVEGATSISVLLPSSYADDSSTTEDLTIEATLVGKDTQTDIAVLKIEKTGLTAAEFGKSSDIQVGEVAIVIGNPLGFELANSVTAGIISAVDRSITVDDRTMNTIQTDASINSGNSGGPLINAYGQVIGITSAKVTSTYGEGLGFAIPIDEAIPIVQELMTYGKVTGRPSLGVSGENVTEVYSQYYDIPKGFFVRGVNSGSCAEKAGIKVNDIVTGIEGTTIETIEQFNDVKNKYKAGDTVTITVYRDGKYIDFDVTLDEVADEVEEEDDNKYPYPGGSDDGYGDYGDYDDYDRYREFFQQFPF